MIYLNLSIEISSAIEMIVDAIKWLYVMLVKVYNYCVSKWFPTDNTVSDQYDNLTPRADTKLEIKGEVDRMFLNRKGDLVVWTDFKKYRFARMEQQEDKKLLSLMRKNQRLETIIEETPQQLIDDADQENDTDNFDFDGKTMYYVASIYIILALYAAVNRFGNEMVEGGMHDNEETKIQKNKNVAGVVCKSITDSMLGLAGFD